MKRRFRTYRRNNADIKKIFFAILGLILVFYCVKKLVDSRITQEQNQMLINVLSSTGLDYLNKYSVDFNLFENNKLINPSTSEEIVNKVDNQTSKVELSDKPLVYIYNSHQSEEYSDLNLAPYNIVPDVMLAADMLKEKLEKRGVGTLVEKRSVEEVISHNNWPYSYTYRVSRTYLEETYENNPSLKYFIDLHRDGANKSVTTAIINDVSYAKIMFLVSKNHDNYEMNLKLVNGINDKIIAFDQSLSRGIFYREKNPNMGTYNQDFNGNTILIELGAQYNTLEEVNNSLEVLADAISIYIMEDLWKLRKKGLYITRLCF